MNLICAIKNAFSWRARPQILVGSSKLTSSELETVEIFNRLNWDQVNGDLLEKHFDVMTLISPEAFCYFLPGILKASVEEEEPDLILATNIVSMLDRTPNPDWWDEFFLARWPKLRIAECVVLQEWLFWLAEINVRSVSDDSLERALQTVELLKIRKVAEGSATL